MTVPHLMNCPHSDDGWCLNCVVVLGNKNWELRDDLAWCEKRIAELEDGLRQIAVWKQEDQDDHEICIRQWRGCVAIAHALLKQTT